MNFAPQKDGSIFNTKALSPSQFKAVFDKIQREQNKNRRKAKNTLTPALLKSKKPSDLVRLGLKADGSKFTMQDLEAMNKSAKSFANSHTSNAGIPYVQLIAQSTSIDVLRANNQSRDGRGINSAYMGSLTKGNIYQSMVNASSVSKHNHHRVQIRFEEWDQCLRESDGSKRGYLLAVKNACRGRLSINCDCGRHQYWYRYMACVGNYAITPPRESAFPKVRNKSLDGLACKHTIKVATMLQSVAWQRPLAIQMEQQASKIGFTDTRVHHFTDKEVKAANHNKRTTTNHDKVKAEYQRYLKRNEALAKKLKQDSDKANKARELLAKAKAKAKSLETENKKLKKLMDQAAKDKLKISIHTFSDAARMFNPSITSEEIYKAYATKYKLPLKAVQGAMK